MTYGMGWPEETRTQVLILAWPLASSDTKLQEQLHAHRLQEAVAKEPDSPAMSHQHCQQHPSQPASTKPAPPYPSWKSQHDHVQTSYTVLSKSLHLPVSQAPVQEGWFEYDLSYLTALLQRSQGNSCEAAIT